MKNILLFLFLVISSFTFSQDDNPYEKFKTGTFTYQAGKQTVLIKRTKKKHIESFEGGRVVMNVEWTSDSTFILTVKSLGGEKGCLSKGDWIKVKIIKAEGETYTAKFYSEFCGNGETVFTRVDKKL